MGSINSNGQLTRTKSTVEMYRVRMISMVKMACADGYVADQSKVNPSEIARWLIAHKCTYCASTYRQYRAALRMWIDEGDHPARANAIEILSSVNDVAHLKRHLSTRTSSTKDKKLSDSDRDSIIDWLRDHPSRYSVALIVLLHIGTQVGLRPCEWKSAHVDRNEDGPAVLKVVNAKSTNGRSNGDVRTLLINGLSVGMVDVINQFIINIRKLDELGKWDNLYNGCRKTLYRACRTLWPHRKKFPTLYSLRHQFCADAKSSGMTKTEVAALMGHGSSATAAEHYGKRRVGRGQCAVKPSEVDVSRLKIKADLVQLPTSFRRQP